MSISEFKEQNILFLKGIHIEDIVSVEDIYQQELLNNIDETTVEIIYDKIPKHFTTLDDWPKSTNLRCWFCSLKFKTIPWFIIENVNHTSEGSKFDIKGNFCSCGCLLGFVKINYNERNDFDIYRSINKLYTIFYNKKISEIKPSPNQYILKIYGGDYTIDDYKKEIKKINDININNGK
jgi:hypothetical protein